MVLYQRRIKFNADVAERQTRWFQVPVLRDVWVQIPSSAPEKDSGLDTLLSLFQLNPPLAEEIHLRWMKSLRDEIRLRRDRRGGFNFI